MKIGMYGGIDNGRVRDRTIDYIAIDQGLSFLLIRLKKQACSKR